MITLEQIRLLESKITRAVDLIRVLKEENSTLRKGLESAQRRMKELETLVDGFKTDQKEIESVIVRTLHNLDELEESAATTATEGGIRAGGISPGGIPAAASGGIPAATGSSGTAAPGVAPSRRSEPRAGGNLPVPPSASAPELTTEKEAEPPSPKEELDIF